MKIDPALSSKFEDLKVMQLEVRNLSIKERDLTLDELSILIQKQIVSSVTNADRIKDLKILRAYRDFYWRVGIDPTKTRPAGEALVRRIISGRGLPHINAFVDSYNLASAESLVAIAAFDLAALDSSKLLMRKAIGGEKFLGIGMSAPIALKGIEVIIEDGREIVAVYPYRDSEATKITTSTKNALLLMCGVPGILESDLEKAQNLSKDYTQRFCKSE